MPPDGRRAAKGAAWRRSRAGATVGPDVRLDILRESPLAFDDAWVQRVVGAALVAHGHRGRAAASILLADDEHLRRLNHTFRGLDKPTDVLSFESDGTLANYLGDIAISVPRALEQADQYGHGAAREVAYLIVHGTLHLLGHDHEGDDDQRKMRAVEEAALARIGLIRPPTAVTDP